MKNLSLTLRLLPVLLAGLAPSAHAEKADRLRDLVIEAAQCTGDGLKEVRSCSGNAVVTKGTLILRGSKLEVRDDPQGNQFFTVTSDASQTAFFRQKREGLDEYYEGQAQTIEYDTKTDTARMIQKAQLRRYRGAVLADESLGALMVYNNTTDQVTLDGQPRNAAKGATNGRVRIVQTPAAAASAPATAPDPKTAPALRSSTSLGGTKP